MTATDPYLDEDGAPDAHVLIGDYWPADGPHSRESVAAAALGIDKLAHYLARATAPWGAGPQVLAQGGDLYRLVGELRSAIGRLDQVLDQAAQRAGHLTEDPTLYDDRRDGRDPAATARELEGALSHARLDVGTLSTSLSAAHSAAAHLGHDDSEQT